VKRKICIATGSRAEYGLLRRVMLGVKDDPALVLQVIATGMHLSPKFGMTYLEIEKDGFHIDYKVKMLLDSDTPVGITKSMGKGLSGFADALHDLAPDLLVVLGDRFEIFSAASAALIARIPIAHIHGGETTEGAFDEAIRHAITKMSHLHFVAAEEYCRRVIQLGEQPERVFLVGGLGVDAIKKQKLLGRPELEKALDFKLGKKNLLVTFHPVTLEDATSSEQMLELLAALEQLEDIHLVFTMPNADTGSRVLCKMIERFVAKRANARVFTSLGQLRYLSCIKHVDGVVGNSSSGLTEVPSFHKGTVNIGDRQRGRLKAGSVIDCAPDRRSILSAIQKLYAPTFKKVLARTRNPYGEGGASEKIVKLLKRYPLEKLIKKSFYNLQF